MFLWYSLSANNLHNSIRLPLTKSYTIMSFISHQHLLVCVCVHVHAHACACAHVNVHMYVHTCVHVCMLVSSCVSAYMYFHFCFLLLSNFFSTYHALAFILNSSCLLPLPPLPILSTTLHICLYTLHLRVAAQAQMIYKTKKRQNDNATTTKHTSMGGEALTSNGKLAAFTPLWWYTCSGSEWRWWTQVMVDAGQ